MAKITGAAIKSEGQKKPHRLKPVIPHTEMPGQIFKDMSPGMENIPQLAPGELLSRRESPLWGHYLINLRFESIQ